ncbi:unnamed protein product [Tilletia laevis]|uniref:Uncharacterized protein n=2 Tax=Tilletia TaxID=13289 RepID=A0A177VAV8_9BASI|nr:hypothetical protein A4X03_0g3288 [Tilletia caries]CAD6903272.1 unnamed protein product [Tilletia controversa]CAD6945879.1 unnamed protein product [Tilletia laevis]CAD6886001.1 unnamed protein product [Tilletia caries]CAD6900136.1 unnamed protein product [Tilletia caries]
METLYACYLTGVVQVDEVEKRTTNKHHSLQGQVSYGHNDEAELQLTASAFYAGSVAPPNLIFAHAAFVGTAKVHLSISSWNTMFQGSVPDNYERKAPIVTGTGKVTDYNEEAAWISFQTAAWNRETAAKVVFDIIGLRLPAARYRNTPMPVRGAIANFTGPLHSQNSINNAFTIVLDDYTWAVPPNANTNSVPTTSTPRKRPALGRRSDSRTSPSSVNGSSTGAEAGPSNSSPTNAAPNPSRPSTSAANTLA